MKWTGGTYDTDPLNMTVQPRAALVNGNKEYPLRYSPVSIQMRTAQGTGLSEEQTNQNAEMSR